MPPGMSVRQGDGRDRRVDKREDNGDWSKNESKRGRRISRDPLESCSANGWTGRFTFELL